MNQRNSFLKSTILIIALAPYIFSCGGDDNSKEPIPIQNNADTFQLSYYGADLSYVNEMEDCGAVYLDVEGLPIDPYQIFSDNGCNLVRLRLWHDPSWFSNYSNFEDVKKSIARARALDMNVLLDFHYSDDWADPSRQTIPEAWRSVINELPALSDSLYNYTYQTLKKLSNENLLPEMVQIGNEINPEILQAGEPVQWPINWNRNSILLNKGIQAVRDISLESGKTIEIMLHIAQPENGLWWFDDALDNGVIDFDWIGLSYYPMWSDYKLNDLSFALETLIKRHNKKLMIVETAYPFTTRNADAAGNILGVDAGVPGIDISPEGQLEFLLELEKEVFEAGADGIVYWEPAWVSTGCSTRWGNGSHWDNATLFDQDKKVNEGMKFYNESLK
ncbi:MAG: glycosyl hydrolase 53 family protein [Cytophagales bacterium]